MAEFGGRAGQSFSCVPSSAEAAVREVGFGCRVGGLGLFEPFARLCKPVLVRVKRGGCFASFGCYAGTPIGTILVFMPPVPRRIGLAV